MIDILPVAPHGTTDQMSPIRAADPLYDQPELAPGPQHWFTPSLLDVHAAPLPTLTLTP
jgi:hypothetical protein